MPDADVPDLIGALAARFQDRDIPTREALAIALCMLVDAMDEPEHFSAYIDDVSVIPVLH